MDTPSLRAQRGNPDCGAVAGLPRRCGRAGVHPERLQGSRRAPRNDGYLRAFAPSRETNFPFSSREAAKSRRNFA